MKHRSMLPHSYVWTFIFAGMCLIPWIAIPMDVAWGTAKAMGRVLNSGLIFSLLFIVALAGALKTLRSPAERAVMLFVTALLTYATVGTQGATINTILSYGGLLAIFGATAAGLCAHALARDGLAPLKTSLLFITLGVLPALSLPWLIQANISDHTYKTWYMNVYGFTNIRAVGHFSAIGIAALAPSAFLGNGRNAILAGVMTTLLWALLFWSGSRAGVVALAPAIFVSALICRKPARAIILNIVWLVIGAGLSALYPIPGSSFGILERAKSTAQAISTNPSVEGINRASSGRLEIWSWALDRISEKPLTGWGYGAMKNFPDSPPFSHTHNIILEYAFAFGIPVATMVLCLLLYLTWRAFKATLADPSPERLGFFCLCLTLPAYSLMSGVLINPYPLTVYLVSLAFAGSLPSAGSDTSPDTSPGDVEPSHQELDEIFLKD